MWSVYKDDPSQAPVLEDVQLMTNSFGNLSGFSPYSKVFKTLLLKNRMVVFSPLADVLESPSTSKQGKSLACF